MFLFSSDTDGCKILSEICFLMIMTLFSTEICFVLVAVLYSAMHGWTIVHYLAEHYLHCSVEHCRTYKCLHIFSVRHPTIEHTYSVRPGSAERMFSVRLCRAKRNLYVWLWTAEQCIRIVHSVAEESVIFFTYSSLSRQWQGLQISNKQTKLNKYKRWTNIVKKIMFTTNMFST